MVTVEKYVKEKQYDNDICDMFLSALCNAMNMKAVVIRETTDISSHVHSISELVLLPSCAGAVPQTTIHLVLTGSGVSAHYSGAVCKQQKPHM